MEEVEIKSLGYNGEGIGRLADGKIVFVPFVLPGERVKIELVEQKKGFARGVLKEILLASPLRQAPKCEHFTHCGGCQLQHTSYSDQLQFKLQIFREQLQRKISKETFNPQDIQIIPSDIVWNYRNTVQFHVSDKHQLGFHAPNSNRVIELHACHIMDSLLFDVKNQIDLQEITNIQRIEIRKGVDEEILISLESNDAALPEFEEDLPYSVVHLGPSGNSILAGDDYVQVKVNERIFSVSAGSFFQVNENVAGKMITFILDQISVNQKTILIDAYCGVGLFSAFFASKVKKCIGIEASSSACRDYAINLDEFENCELYEGSTEEILPYLDVKPDLVIFDPPRNGVDRQALEAMFKLAPDHLVYVSCDPATFIRDMSLILENGYNLIHSRIFDLFPQTFHIETVNIFQKRAKLGTSQS